MPRARTFDTDEVIGKAMEVFWWRGFEATTIDHLVEATGLGRGSLYAAFGSKHELYELALRRYVRETTEATRQALARQVPVRQVMRDLLLGRIDDALSVPGRPGCLLVMAVTERVPHDEATARIVQDAIKALQDSFRASLHLARSMGSLPADADIPVLADFLVTMIQGLRVMSAALLDRSTMAPIVEAAIQAIPE